MANLLIKEIDQILKTLDSLKSFIRSILTLDHKEILYRVYNVLRDRESVPRLRSRKNRFLKIVISIALVILSIFWLVGKRGGSKDDGRPRNSAR